MKEIDDFLDAVSKLNIACANLGIKPPSAITFRTGRDCNLISDELIKMRISGHPYAEQHVHVGEGDRVSIDDIVIKVAW